MVKSVPFPSGVRYTEELCLSQEIFSIATPGNGVFWYVFRNNLGVNAQGLKTEVRGVSPSSVPLTLTTGPPIVPCKPNSPQPFGYSLPWNPRDLTPA